jgi:hypothetical protein
MALISHAISVAAGKRRHDENEKRERMSRRPASEKEAATYDIYVIFERHLEKLDRERQKQNKSSADLQPALRSLALALAARCIAL